MSVEELLKPRYKVIADYPFSVFPKDLVFELNILDARKHLAEQEYYMIYKENCYSESLINKYPAIFKKLEWWEDRKESDMPEYVKFPDQFKKGKFNVIKIGEEYRHGFDDHPFLKNGDAEYFGLRQIKGAGGIYRSQLLPATKEEYESQK